MIQPEALAGKLSELETYEAWTQARNDYHDAETLVPHRFVNEDRKHLLAKIDYLDAKDTEDVARGELMLDIARTDETFLPLAYRLGSLAAFDVTRGVVDNQLLPSMESLERSLEAEMRSLHRLERLVSPSSNPIIRATQIGSLVTEIKEKLNTTEKVPVAMVHQHRFLPPRQSYDVVLTGIVENNESAYTLQEPEVTEDEDGVSVVYSIPDKLGRVADVKAASTINTESALLNNFSRLWAPDEYRKVAIPPIVDLSKLIGKVSFFSVHELHIGNEDVAKRLDLLHVSESSYRRTQVIRQRRNRLYR